MAKMKPRDRRIFPKVESNWWAQSTWLYPYNPNKNYFMKLAKSILLYLYIIRSLNDGMGIISLSKKGWPCLSSKKEPEYKIAL